MAGGPLIDAITPYFVPRDNLGAPDSYHRSFVPRPRACGDRHVILLDETKLIVVSLIVHCANFGALSRWIFLSKEEMR